MTPVVSVFFFFFSSRRRHTRYWRDWSSDVCSSDLMATWETRSTGGDLHLDICSSCHPFFTGKQKRSEERRVGKECRSRRPPRYGKKKLQSQYAENKHTEK